MGFYPSVFSIPSFDGKVNSAIFRVANIEKREWFWVETRNMHRKTENAVSDTIQTLMYFAQRE